MESETEEVHVADIEVGGGVPVGVETGDAHIDVDIEGACRKKHTVVSEVRAQKRAQEKVEGGGEKKPVFKLWWRRCCKGALIYFQLTTWI